MSTESNAAAVPLIVLLRLVPVDAVLKINTPNALGCPDTHSIAVGRLCHEAAAALVASRLAALEEAAKIAEGLTPANDLSDWTEFAHTRADAFAKAAAAIRGLGRAGGAE